MNHRTTLSTTTTCVCRSTCVNWLKFSALLKRLVSQPLSEHLTGTSLIKSNLTPTGRINKSERIPRPLLFVCRTEPKLQWPHARRMWLSCNPLFTCLHGHGYWHCFSHSCLPVANPIIPFSLLTSPGNEWTWRKKSLIYQSLMVGTMHGCNCTNTARL